MIGAGIFLIAQEALIEDNEIRVLTSLVAGTRSIIRSGRGGLQIGGTSEQVRVKNNLISNGIGNGITLGSLEEVDDNGLVNFPFIPWSTWILANVEPCDECNPVSPRIPQNLTIDPGGGGGGGNGNDETHDFRSSSPLYDITIENNRIYDMGLNGIGVVGFFDLSVFDEFITVNGLTICNNDIQRCLSRPLAPIDTEMIDSMGYGGIALADVENLVICHNKFENNGTSFLELICGIFVLHAEGVNISNNRILNNGAKFKTQEEPEQGRRGGINIVLAVAPTVLTSISSRQNSIASSASIANSFLRQNDVPAAKIHDNIVSQPVGRALTLTALGSVSVLNNQFTSRGVPIVGQLNESSVGATVIIANLGISNEFRGQLHNFSGIISGKIRNKTFLDVDLGAPSRAS